MHHGSTKQHHSGICSALFSIHNSTTKQITQILNGKTVMRHTTFFGQFLTISGKSHSQRLWHSLSLLFDYTVRASHASWGNVWRERTQIIWCQIVVNQARVDKAQISRGGKKCHLYARLTELGRTQYFLGDVVFTCTFHGCPYDKHSLPMILTMLHFHKNPSLLCIDAVGVLEE